MGVIQLTITHIIPFVLRLLRGCFASSLSAYFEWLDGLLAPIEAMYGRGSAGKLGIRCGQTRKDLPALMKKFALDLIVSGSGSVF